MPWMLVGVGVVAFLALLSSLGKNTAHAAPSRPSWMDVLSRLADASLEELQNAYREARKAGYNDTAEEIQRELDIRYGLNRILVPYSPEAEEAEQTEDEAPPAYDKQLSVLSEVTSPLEGIRDGDWRDFEEVMRTGNLDTITPGWSLGLYKVNARRLGSLGYMTNVREDKYDAGYGARRVWKGDFVDPYTMESFLSDPLSQYGMFAHDMQDLRPMVEKMYGDYIGKSAEGKLITLSGLLALAKMAGVTGMGSWLSNESDHARFQNTTEMFKKATGIF